jgi:heat shock protein HslJ
LIPEGSYVVLGSMSDGEMKPIPKDVEATIEIGGDQIAGKAACNRFFGTIRPDGGFGPLATTMMMCPPPLMDYEYAFLDLLSRVDGVRSDDSAWVLVEGDTDLVRLAPVG